jgi:hypothetical protein
MSELSEAVKYIEDYLVTETSDLKQTLTTVNLSSFNNPFGEVNDFTQTTVVSNVQKALVGNPVTKAIGDTATQIVTTTVQSLVRDVFKHNNLAPIQNSVQTAMQFLATIATLDVELAMELTRNTARNLIVVINRKKKISSEIRSDLTKLHNACIILLNSTPFVDKYVRDLLTALQYIEQSQDNFDNVLQGLESPTNPTFKKASFNDGIALLEKAQALVLPDRGNVTSDLITYFDYLDKTINRPTNQQAIAAASAIPNISQSIGTKVLQYVAATTEINLLLNTYADAIDGYIASFTKNTNLYKIAYDHISTGQKQLNSLSENMSSILLPSSSNPQLDPSQLTYGPKLMASATAWGITLQGIIEWMKLNPGVGASQIDQTSRSVAAYKKSIELISEMGNISYTGGTYVCGRGREEPLQLVKKMASLLIKVNTIVATSKTKYEITDEFRYVRNFLDASDQNSNRLLSALQVFTSTQPSIPTEAKKQLDKILEYANSQGLDRLAGLLNTGDVRKIFGITGETATYTGAAVAGVNKLLTVFRGSTTATDTQVQKIEELRDTYDRQKKSEDVAASRSYASGIAAVRELIEDKIKQIKQTLTQAIETAKVLDSEAGSTNDVAATAISSVIPGFNANSALADAQNQFIDPLKNSAVAAIK